MTVPYTFANQTSAIPLSELDSNFATPITIGGTPVQLGGTVSAISNVNVSGATATATGSTTARTIANHFGDMVNVKDFGAKGDGVTDDSAAIQAALAAGNSVYFPWGIYICKEISIGTHKTLYCNNSIFKPAPSAQHVFLLTGYRPALFDGYFDDGLYVIPNTLTNAFVKVQDCSYPTISNCMWVNQTVALLIGGTSGDTSKGFFDNLNIFNFKARGILIGKNASACSFSNVNCWSGITAPDNVPKLGAIGFQHVATGSTLAFGGHLLTNVTALESETGFQFTDSNLVTLQNCIGDSVAGAAYQLTGACDKMKFDNCFAGTAKIGYEVDDTCSNIWISNATTVLQGVVPPWWVGPASFYLTTGNYAVARDFLFAAGTNVKVGPWFSDAYSLYAAGTISFINSDSLFGGSTSSVASGSTVYLTTAGAQATEIMTWVAPKKGIIYGLQAQSGQAPGAGQSYTYTVRQNFASSGATCTTSGTGVFGSSTSTPVLFNAGDNIAVQLVTSASATAANHRFSLKIYYMG